LDQFTYHVNNCHKCKIILVQSVPNNRKIIKLNSKIVNGMICLNLNREYCHLFLKEIFYCFSRLLSCYAYCFGNCSHQYYYFFAKNKKIIISFELNWIELSFILTCHLHKQAIKKRATTTLVQVFITWQQNVLNRLNFNICLYFSNKYFMYLKIFGRINVCYWR